MQFNIVLPPFIASLLQLNDAFSNLLLCRELEARALSAHLSHKQNSPKSSSPKAPLASSSSRVVTSSSPAASLSVAGGQSANTQNAVPEKRQHAEAASDAESTAIRSDMVDVPLTSSPTVSKSVGYSRMV